MHKKMKEGKMSIGLIQFPYHAYGPNSFNKKKMHMVPMELNYELANSTLGRKNINERHTSINKVHKKKSNPFSSPSMTTTIASISLCSQSNFF